MELCPYLTTTPVAQANFRLSDYLGKLPELTSQNSISLQLQIYIPQELALYKLQAELLCSRKHKISTFKNIWTVKYFYYYHHPAHST